MQSKVAIIWKPLVAVLFWGLSFIATKYALNEVKPLVIVFIRQLLGISFLAVVAVKRKRSFAINFKDQSAVFILALIASFHLWIQVTGLQYTSASNTGWIIGMTPVFMALLAFFVFREKITAPQFWGIVIAFGGLLLLVSKGDLTSVNFISNKGDFLVLASSFTWSIYSIVSKKATVNYPPVMTIFYLFLTMAVIVAPFTINAENFNAVINLSAGGWLSIIFLGVLCSGVSYVLWAEAMKEMPASKVGAFLYIEPFVTVFAAWALLSEQISILTMISGMIIIAGVIIVNRK